MRALAPQPALKAIVCGRPFCCFREVVVLTVRHACEGTLKSAVVFAARLGRMPRLATLSPLILS